MADHDTNSDQRSGHTIDAAFEQLIDKALLAFKANASDDTLNEVIEKEAEKLKTQLVNRGRQFLRSVKL